MCEPEFFLAEEQQKEEIQTRPDPLNTYIQPRSKHPRTKKYSQKLRYSVYKRNMNRRSDVKFCVSQEKLRFVKLVGGAAPSGGELGRMALTGPPSQIGLYQTSIQR